MRADGVEAEEGDGHADDHGGDAQPRREAPAPDEGEGGRPTDDPAKPDRADEGCGAGLADPEQLDRRQHQEDLEAAVDHVLAREQGDDDEQVAVP